VGLFFGMADLIDTRKQPDPCRAIVFIDGQNLFKATERAFGHRHPLYDPLKLAPFMCRKLGWNLAEIRLYTGIPPVDKSPFWHFFWARKKTQMARRGVICNTRPTHYRPHKFRLPDGTEHFETVPEEKGIDVWLAVDLISLAHDKKYDSAIIFSQDQDLCPAVDEVKKIAVKQSRWIKLVSAYPLSHRVEFRMGIKNTDYEPIDEDTFNTCLDTFDYVGHAAEDAKKYHGSRR
jgi:uncharacterized LabA/DUF88 family protein